MSVRDRISRHWFAPAPLRDLAYLRTALVFVLLAGSMWPGKLELQLTRARLPAEWYVPLPALKLLMLPFGWGARPGPLLITGMWILCGAAGLFALVGARTRISLALFAFANTFLVVHLLSYGTLQHPQAPATILLWVLLLTPCGAELSVDALRARVAETASRERFAPRDAIATSPDARWPLRLAQWLLVLVYLSAGVSKLVVGKGAWLNGYTMEYYFLVDGIGHSLPLSLAIAHLRWFGIASAVVTLAFELTFAAGVLWPRTFPVYAAVGTGLHTGIFLLMRAPFFQFVALYAAWADPLRDARRRIAHVDDGRAWTLVYDGYCPLCIRTMAQLDELDGARKLRYVDLERDTTRARELLPGASLSDMRREMALVTPSGAMFRGFFAFRELSRQLPLLWALVPFMYVPGASWVGTRVYAWVAANRARRLCEGDRCAVH
ncbi:MAG: DCC1-like thiol-disulfide oxidoreductase family protein, partial [Gemmatimonadaceae bacterium]